MSTLFLPAEMQSTLRAWSKEALPREACGFLLGTARGDRLEVWAVLRSHNLADGADAFALDPGATVAAEREARTRGLDLVGFWHSHPRALALPSSADARGAWPGHAHVIVGLRGRPSIRAWRCVDGILVESVIEGRVEGPDGLRARRIGPQSAAFSSDPRPSP